MSADPAIESRAWKALEPYARLVTSLMPLATSVHVFDDEGWLRWSTEAMTGPDLPAAIQEAQQEALRNPRAVGRMLRVAGDPSPVYVWWLRNDEGAFLATVAIATHRQGDGHSGEFEGVHALVRPAMECLRAQLVTQSSVLRLHRSLTARDKDVELLLSVTDGDASTEGDRVDDLKVMLQNAASHMDCALSALIVPEKSIAIMSVPEGRSADASVLARTHRQLLQLVQTRREAVVIDRVGTASEQLPYRILCCPVKHPGGRVMGVLALFRASAGEEFQARDARLVELVARRASAKIEASYDALTGLLTRQAFEHLVRARMAEPGRPRKWSALYLDCDQLHVVNDNFGMHVGDGVLSQLGELVRGRLPPGGLAARISGDRFALAVPLEDLKAAECAEQLRQAAEQIGATHALARLHTSITVGVAAIESTDQDALGHALAAAESACKAGKDRGRNRVEVHEANDASIIRRFTDITTSADLRDALANQRMRLDAQLIQPLGPPVGGSVPHYELLLRMIGPQGETIGPERFMSAAQRYQMMPTIDRWVFEQAVTLLAPHAELLAGGGVVFSINFSGQSLNDPAFPDFLLSRIEGCGINPRAFCFELTESEAVSNIARAELLMRRLRRIGCGVALDDFGTGLSSLAYLRSLPVTLLKIDGSFVRDILRDPRSESMVQAITQLAHTMSISTVAEYVETEEIRQRVETLGVDYGQGFAIARPVPILRVLEELPLLAAAVPTPRLPAAAAPRAPRRAAG
jgi:diguanylate cyclase (GGDEF)-like protein